MVETILISSSLAALISRTIMHPVDTIRIRKQLGDSINKGKLKNNVVGLYSGFSIALLFTLPGISLFYTSYNVNKSLIHQHFNINKESTTNHALSGFASSCIAGLIFNPMEVIKGYLQVQNKNNLSTILKNIYKKQGLVGFQNGFVLSTIVFGPHNLIYFSLYEKFKLQFNEQKLQNYLMSAAAATAAAATITHPLEVIRARYQFFKTQQNFQSEKIKLSTQQLISSIYKKGGIRSFYSGILMRYLYFIPNTTLSMTLFELFKNHLNNNNNNNNKSMLI